MNTRNQPRKNYAEPKDDESTIHSSEEREYNSELTKSDGQVLSQDMKFIDDGDSSSVDPDAPYIVRSAPVSTQYSESSYYSDYTNVIFIEKRKKTQLNTKFIHIKHFSILWEIQYHHVWSLASLMSCNFL